MKSSQFLERALTFVNLENDQGNLEGSSDLDFSVSPGYGLNDI